MRIALFLPTLGGGGAQKVMLNLAQGFRDLGVNVDLVLGKVEGPNIANIPAGIKVIDLGGRRVIRSLPALVNYLYRRKPDVLLSAIEHANVAAIWAAWLAGKTTRVVISVHTTISRASQSSSGKRLRIMPTLIRKFYPCADAIVVVSKSVKDDLLDNLELDQQKIHVIYNPVVTPDLFIKAKRTLSDPWFSPGQPPVILGAGRLVEAKDFPTLIRAFALVRKRQPSRLVILGDGEDKLKLEELAVNLNLTDDLKFIGFVENPYNYMANAAVFVLSSAWEGLPTVLIEALALHTPVVSTDCQSGPYEILSGGKYGKLVAVGDVEALAAGILEITLHKQVNEISSEALKPFTLDTSVNKYLQVVRHVLDM